MKRSLPLRGKRLMQKTWLECEICFPLPFTSFSKIFVENLHLYRSQREHFPFKDNTPLNGCVCKNKQFERFQKWSDFAFQFYPFEQKCFFPLLGSSLCVTENKHSRVSKIKK